MKIQTKAGYMRKAKGLMRKAVPLLCVLALASCSLIPESLLPNQSQAGTQQQNAGMLIPVVRGTIASTMSFVGNLQYSQSADLSWKTEGVIDQVNVKVGDNVKKGDILAVLATDSLNSSVLLAEKTMIEQQEKLEDVQESEQARMQAYVTLNSKESALKEAKLEQEALYYPRATQDEIERAWDSFALANLNFNYAKQDYDHLVEINEPWEGYEEDRVVRMFGRTFTLGGDSRSGRERKFEDYVSTYNTLVSAYEDYVWISGEPTATDYAVAEGNVQVAQMEYDKALEEYLSYETIPREKDVHAAEVSLNAAETSYNQRFIIAQFDGTVTSVTAVEGYYVSKGSAALRLDDMSRIFIPISVPELDVSQITNGTEVSITVDALSGKTYSGWIYSLADASTASGNTTSFSAMVEVKDLDPQMLAGMTAEISLRVKEKNNVLLIPNTAITYTNGKPYVTVSDGSTRQTVEVQLGIMTDSISEVTSGDIREGSQLVVSSISRNALTALGLDPADYLGSSREMPQGMPQGSFNGEMPERPASDIAPTVEVNTKPTATAVPTQKPTATTVSETDESAESEVQPTAVLERQFPEMPSDGSFPPMDESGEFQGPLNGQRPNMDGAGEFPGGFGNGQRPGRDGSGQFPGRDSAPAESDTNASEKG